LAAPRGLTKAGNLTFKNRGLWHRPACRDEPLRKVAGG
jgi:hypothetical protein